MSLSFLHTHFNLFYIFFVIDDLLKLELLNFLFRKKLVTQSSIIIHNLRQ